MSKNETLSSILTISEIESVSDNEFLVKFFIDSSNPILKGHFPGQPILPGVVMVDLVKSCFERAKEDSFQLVTAGNIKFLRLLVPNDEVYHLSLNIKEHEESINVSAQINQNEVTYFKQSASYIRK